MAISYNRLGSNGRLGNQMFQYAALRGIAAHHGFDWLIPKPDTYGDSNYGLFDCFKMESVKEDNFGILNYNNISTKNMSFEIKVEEEIRKCHTNFILYGIKK